jgi:GrpB-like predicted nucleotidyltransferase (UPF0157 family)
MGETHGTQVPLPNPQPAIISHKDKGKFFMGSNKILSEMSPEELGKLFPIIISEADAKWPLIFQKEKECLIEALGSSHILQIDHIGSTAVPGLAAKPTIDILIQIDSDCELDRLTKKLQTIEYQCIPKPENPPPGLMFAKGYTPEGFRGQAFHIHVRYGGDWHEIHFRDYLRKSPETLKAYAKLKRHLANSYRNNRDGYTEAKTDFIQEVLGRLENEKADSLPLSK